MRTTTRLQRGFTGYVLLAALVVGGLGVWGAMVWDKGRMQAARQAGYDQAKAEDQAAQTAAENRSLLNQREQIINLTNELTEARNAHDATKQDLGEARARAFAAGQRVRSAAAPTGDLEDRLAAAQCPIVRSFAAGAFRTAQSCRDAVAEIGLGSGGLVESAASARYEHARAEALMRFSMPRSPFTQPKE